MLSTHRALISGVVQIAWGMGKQTIIHAGVRLSPHRRLAMDRRTAAVIGVAAMCVFKVTFLSADSGCRMTLSSHLVEPDRL